MVTNDDTLVLDPRIRDWVLIPISLVTFLVVVIRHYFSIILQRKPKLRLEKVQDAAVLMRCSALKMNSYVLPQAQFLMRKAFFNDNQNGFFRQKREAKGLSAIGAAFTNPEAMTAQASGMLTGMGPQMALGAWVQYFYAGSAACKLPFPLSERFRGMLQSGIEMTGVDLDVSYVSGLSWYILNIFGNQGLFQLLMNLDISSPPGQGSRNPSDVPQIDSATDLKIDTVFETERQNIDLITHQWKIFEAEELLLKENNRI